jgi:pimeloyl-ACP methyl ester carboxylesterase
LTGHWRGHVAFRENAADLAALARTAIPEAAEDTNVVGHSWGAMTAAAFPAVGYAARRIVLVDPPTLPLETIRQMMVDPSERRYDDLDEAIGVVGRLNPTYGYGDVVAKAEALTQFDEPAVRAILTENGDWDGGLAALGDAAAQHVPVRLIRGDPAFGGLIPDVAVPAFQARLGDRHVVTIVGGPHSPHRTHPAETVEAILAALR